MIINLSNTFFWEIPTWLVEENRFLFTLKPAPPPSAFAVFLAGDQFAGKTGNSVKNKFLLFVEEFKEKLWIK